jgi:hypothetical protein
VNYTIQILEATNSSDGTLVVSSEVAFEFLARKLQQMFVAVTNFFCGLTGQTIGYPSTIPVLARCAVSRAMRSPTQSART